MADFCLSEESEAIRMIFRMSRRALSRPAISVGQEEKGWSRESISSPSVVSPMG